jgi:hypothetical protein
MGHRLGILSVPIRTSASKRSVGRRIGSGRRPTLSRTERNLREEQTPSLPENYRCSRDQYRHEIARTGTKWTPSVLRRASGLQRPVLPWFQAVAPRDSLPSPPPYLSRGRADVPTMAQHQPGLTVARKPRKQRVRCVCGVEVFGNKKYCDEHRPLQSDRVKAQWERWRAEGIDSSHGGAVAKKRGEAFARSNSLKQRASKQAMTD